MAFILTDYAELIGTITFNHPEKRNALSSAMLEEIDAALDDFQERKARVIVVRAPRGATVWSSGFNVNELPEPGKDPLAYYDPLESTLRHIQKFPTPVIALIEGSVWGGACDLSFTCDLAIGAPSVSFAMTPAKLGLPYSSTGILHFINIVGARHAREMFFTAQPIAAEHALEIGILNALVPSDQLDAYTYNLASQIAANSPLSISVMKEQMRILSESHPLSPETFERIQGLRRRVYTSGDYHEGKQAFLEKRKPAFKGK